MEVRLQGGEAFLWKPAEDALDEAEKGVLVFARQSTRERLKPSLGR